MALSLRDKLRSTAPAEKKAAQPRSDHCLVRQHRYAPADSFLCKSLSGNTLSIMQGMEMSDICREDILFLDTETTGLSGGAGTVAFLVGVGYFEKDALIIEQYLMRDYDEEVYVLQKVQEQMCKRRILCTFNGITFDLPLLRSRGIMQRIRMPEPQWHIDLLHAARRVWKLRLKKCNLTALEEAVLGRERVDDLPGAMVPERYFRFLKEKNMELLEDVLRHNEQDIASLSGILQKLLCLHAAPLDAEYEEDIYSLGRIYERRGNAEYARKCYRASSKGSTVFISQTSLAENLRKAGEYQGAVRAYEAALRAKHGDLNTHIALAKLYEHRMKNLDAALRHTRQALMIGVEMHDYNVQPIQIRYERIMKKIRRNEHGIL